VSANKLYQLEVV